MTYLSPATSPISLSLSLSLSMVCGHKFWVSARTLFVLKAHYLACVMLWYVAVLGYTIETVLFSLGTCHTWDTRSTGYCLD